MKELTLVEKQRFIIDALHVRPTINSQEEIRTRVDFLKSFIQGSHRKGFVLGISGGQDSTLAGRLAQIAVDELVGEGYDVDFLALRLPYGIQRDEDDAQLALDFIRPSATFDFNIKATVDAFATTFNAIDENTNNLSDYDKGNVKARVRMVTQYAYASAGNRIVIGTGHASEYVGGYETKYGDGGADILPLNGLNKRQGKELLKALGSTPRLYEKLPTADLLDEKPGQEDETELGVTYNEIDDFLEGKIIDIKSAEIIINRFFATEHKRRTPYIPQEVV